MKFFLSPVFRCAIEGTAETQHCASEVKPKSGSDHVITTIDETDDAGYKAKSSPRLLDRWLDAAVRFAGSAPVFLFIVAGLLTWALLGIRFGQSDVWVAAISDVQAIMCYIFDSLLMRQLLREYSEQQEAMVQIQSRCTSHRRMLEAIKEKLGPEGIARAAELCKDDPPLPPLDQGLDRAAGPFARLVIWSAKAFGHVTTVGLYWVGIFVWLGFGPHCGWSSRWQLYINDATSALMILVFAFLACLRECFADQTNICLDSIFKLDAKLERELRRVSRDELPNLTVTIAPPKESYLQMVIFYYADIIGTLVGIIILVLVVIAWVVVGPVFHFNNTWWLLIGTYAGLVGLFDSFVLRNIQSKVNEYVTEQVVCLEKQDMMLYSGLSVPIPRVQLRPPSLSQRVSHYINTISSHLLMVVAGLVLTLGCIVASSAMKWSLTGQLISNVPPSIIETFFMLILITGHNYAEKKLSADLTDIYHRRQRLLAFVGHAEGVVECEEEVDSVKGVADSE
ncbi:Low affinity iron permease-domain-containing protein [Penicillium cosmopolitanum]|uniref:Low affinity iron permease-domain-containing protein n=1 Tax=Penicillium cosmopolitanum TaxID=1131564 RepID=A0A9W9VZ45_9EURO|nr:Low affinity iron permease-domain-containing protein [Penicillium cosmopolitanum]KAJ5392009.1 Low affinity iron permease-domain-containing protein [Penicillium cosmopolitanum]